MFIVFCSAPQQPCQQTPSPRQRQDCGNLTGISSAYFLFWPCNASCFRSSLSAIKAPCHHTSVHFSGWNTTQSTTNWAILNKWSQKSTADQSSGSALVTEDVCHEMRWCYHTSQLPELQSCGSSFLLFTDRRAHLLLECDHTHLQPQHSCSNTAAIKPGTAWGALCAQRIRHHSTSTSHLFHSIGAAVPSVPPWQSRLLVGSVVKPSRITPALTITWTPRHWSHTGSVSSSDQVSGANGHHRKAALNAQSVKGEAIIWQDAAVLIPFASLKRCTIRDEVFTASVLHWPCKKLWRCKSQG